MPKKQSVLQYWRQTVVDMRLVSDYLVLAADGKGYTGVSCVLRSPFVVLWSPDVRDPLMSQEKIKGAVLF